MAEPVKVPTAKSIGSSFKDLGYGALGGAILAIGVRVFGPVAFLAAPVLAGSMLKGDTGKVITAVSGIALGMALLGGGVGNAGSSTPQDI